MASERDGPDLVVRDDVAAAADRGGDRGAGRAALSEETVSDGTTRRALLARKTWRTLEPLHGMIYFVPEAAEAYARLGITGRAGYFASRAAPDGRGRRPRWSISTFFNFNPELVRAAIPASWEVATPTRSGRGALRGGGRRLPSDPGRQVRRVAGDGPCRRAGPDARPRSVAGRTRGPPAGRRPRRAGVARASRTWCCGTRSRSCASTGATGTSRCWSTHGLSGIEALVTHAAAGDVPAGILRSPPGVGPRRLGRRRRSRCASGAGSSRATSCASPTWGAAQRQEIEDETDVLAAAPYAALGEEGCAELRTLARPWSKTFSEVLSSECRRHPLPSPTLLPFGRRAFGRLAQLVRAAGLQPAGRGFESLSAHSVLWGERGHGPRTTTKGPRNGRRGTNGSRRASPGKREGGQGGGLGARRPRSCPPSASGSEVVLVNCGS